MDNNERTRKNDPHKTAQNASSHHSDRENTKLENKRDVGGKDVQDDEISEATNESGKEDSTNDECDQDNSISLGNGTESTSSQEEEEEDWIEYVKKEAQ